MTNEQTGAGGIEFKDRKAGLVAFGILQVLLGALCALFVPLMIFGMYVSSVANKSSAPPVTARTIVPGVLFYGLLAVWFIWMGIGSIIARRWARALLVVTSWMWLICGIMGLAVMLLFLPDMYSQMAKNGQMPPQAIAIVKGIMFGFMTLFYLILPGSLILFYGSRHVKATCERRDPLVRWTDKCPLPVLAVSLMSGSWAACMLLLGFYRWAIPLFGVILSGAAGATAALVIAALLAYVAWGAYRLEMRAWWCAVCVLVLWGGSAAVTFSRMNLMDLYGKMGFPAEQLAQMKQFLLPGMSPWVAVASGVWLLAMLAYMGYVKRYFMPSAGQRSAPSGERV